MAIGPIIWMTGPPGAGKTTIAAELRPRLEKRWSVEILDGDEVRSWLTDGLGFSRADRDRNVARIARLACLLARHGTAVVVAAVSPYAEARDKAKALAGEQAIPFFEVFVTAPLAILLNRDPKGMYRKAQAGELPNFTGLTDPYEEPTSPSLALATHTDSADRCAARVEALLMAEVPATRDFRGGGLTFDEQVKALKHIGYDLTCSMCASVYYTGGGSYPHDPGCQTILPILWDITRRKGNDDFKT